MNKRAPFFCLCLLVAASAASAAVLPDKGYPGPERPLEELAVFSALKSGARMTLHKIDGVVFKPEIYARSVVFEVYVLPGVHTFELSLWGKGEEAVVKELTFTAEAGKFYALDGKSFAVRDGKGKGAAPVESRVEDVPYYAEPGAGEERAVLEKAVSVKASFILFRIDGLAGHPARNGNARFNVGLDDGAFTVAVRPGERVIEYNATVKGWDYATGPKASTITVEAGKTYLLQAVRGDDGSAVVVAVEKD